MTVVIGGLTAYIFYDADKIIDDLDKDEALSKNVTAEIKNLFYQKNIAQYPYLPKDEVNFKNYIVLKYGNFVDDDGKTYGFNYDNSVNQKLELEGNINNKNLDGIIFLNAGSKDLGNYYKKNILSGDSQTSTKAFQQYFGISYLDVKSKIIVKRDTLFGPMPKEQKSQTETTGTRLPNDEAVIERLKSLE